VAAGSHQVEQALEHWREPEPAASGRCAAAQALHLVQADVLGGRDRGARLARMREDTDAAARWQKAADEIHADICANALDERGVFCQHYETRALDASLLLMPLLRFCRPTIRGFARPCWRSPTS